MINLKKELIAVNHIGTSVIESIESELGQMVKMIEDAQIIKATRYAQIDDYEAETVLTFSSLRAIKKLEQKGFHVQDINDIIRQSGKYDRITIIPLHVIGGTDYMSLKKSIVSNNNISLLSPLLVTRSDCQALGIKLSTILKADKDKSILFVGHGTTDESHKLYQLLEEELIKIGINARVLTLEDKEALSLIKVEDEIVIFPLFAISGHHVKNDLFRSQNSFRAILLKRVNKVKSYEHGLLFYPEIREMYLSKLDR